jgi:hypothetical protein
VLILKRLAITDIVATRGDHRPTVTPAIGQTQGKAMLERVVSMLTKLVARFESDDSDTPQE